MQEIQQTKQYIGIRNTVASKSEPKHWKYLLFHETDNHTEAKATLLKSAFECCNTSYIIYKTMHGYHAVGLTPMSCYQWGINFHSLQLIIPEYYNGNVIRISPKNGEERRLFAFNLKYPFIQKLADRYCKLLGINYVKSPIEQDYKIFFERYWSI